MAYSGRNEDKRYAGETVDIAYNPKRCIHAEQCVHRLASVFKKDARPWIDANGAPAKDIISVVSLCPSGALHAQPKNGAVPEEPAQRNAVLLWKDGPLQCVGNLEIRGANFDIRDETRVTLCRCGQSDNKPFCDNSHRTSAFEAIDADNSASEVRDNPMGIVTITLERNGPYHVTGKIEILNAAGKVIFAGEETRLCRCGQSARKPFCDGTHGVIGFQAD